jgi:hypothetical protein
MSDHAAESKDSVELPAPTAWPLVLGLGIALVGTGFATNIGFLVVGVIVFFFGLGGWIGQLVSIQGDVQEPLVAMPFRPAPTEATPGTVEALRPGAAGYRFRLPEHVHPISSGVKGGLLGGLLMSLPAMAYSLYIHGSPWVPVNLLAGMVIPGITYVSLEDIRQFHELALIFGLVVHAAFSITFGLLFGVILPMLPNFRGAPILFGGVLPPILWTGFCYSIMDVVDPLLQKHVDWQWFIVSQFVFGVTMSIYVSRTQKIAVEQFGR